MDPPGVSAQESIEERSVMVSQVENQKNRTRSESPATFTAALEKQIRVSLELALWKAQHGEWDAAWDIVDGLWSPFMALELERGVKSGI